MKIKKTFLFFQLLCVFMVLPAGCAQRSAAADRVTEFTYWTVNSVYEAYHLKKAEEWNALHPDRKISLNTRVIEGDRINDKLWTTLHSGILVSGYDAPDLVDIEYQDYDDYVSQSNCLLYPLFDENSVSANKQFDAYIYRSLCFGIPYGMDKMVLYYNNKLLTEAGVDVARMKTWEDFLACGKQYFQKTGKTFTSIDASHYDFYITLLSQKNTDYFNTALGLKSRKSLETLDFMERLVVEHAAALTPGGRTESNLFYTAFSKGEIAVLIDQLSNAAALSVRLPEMYGQIGIAQIPQMDAGDAMEVWVPSYATAITMSCSQYELLKAFLEFARLDDSAWESMAVETGSGLYPCGEKTAVSLKAAGFARFYCDDIVPLYTDDSGSKAFLPNVTTVNAWIDNYEYDLAKRLFVD